MVYAPSSSSSGTEATGVAPSDMSSQAFDAEWSAVSNSVKSAPADQREQLEDQQFLAEYNSGQISANDLNKLLTKADGANQQVDPGKEAVQRAEAWAQATGQKLTDQQKNIIATSARQQAAQQKLAMVQNVLTSEYRNQPPGAHQAVAIGFSVFDANGNKQNVLARVDAQGNFDQLQKISDLGNGYSDQVLIDNAVDDLRSKQAADPGKPQSEEVNTPGGKFKVALDANGNASVTKEQSHSFWGSLVGFVENVVAPVALAMVPGVGVGLAAAYEGVKGGIDIANGNTLGGLAEIFGGVAGVGGAIGGAVGGAVQDGAEIASAGVNVDASVASGNPLGAIAAAAGVGSPLGDIAGSFGDDGLTDAIAGWAPDISTAAKFGSDISSGNIAGALGIASDAAPDIADQLGVSDGFTDSIGNWASDASTVAQVGQDFAKGDYLGALGQVSNIAPGLGDLLGPDGESLNNLISQITPYVTAGTQLRQGVQGISNAVGQGNVLSAISSSAQEAMQLPALVQQIRDELGGYGN